jgi:hypothetical protein
MVNLDAKEYPGPATADLHPALKCGLKPCSTLGRVLTGRVRVGCNPDALGCGPAQRDVARLGG